MSEDAVLIRRAQAIQDVVDRGSDFATAPGPVLAKVVDLGQLPTAGNTYVACHQMRCGGREVEGGSATLEEGSEVFYTAVVGSTAPKAGDYLIARAVPDGRWASDVPVTPSGQGVNLTGCPCALVPIVLNMGVTNPTLNFRIFQPATLVYGPTPPEYAGLPIGANSFLSTGEFTDNVTSDPFRYWFRCLSGLYVLTRVYVHSVFGSPHQDIIRYQWLGGITGNTCSPYAMTHGQIFPGGNAATVVTITG